MEECSRTDGSLPHADVPHDHAGTVTIDGIGPGSGGPAMPNTRGWAISPRPPDLQPPLEGSQQPIGVALRMFGLQPLEQLASRSRRIGVEPGPQLRRHRDERVRPAPATLLLRLGLRRRPDPPLPPGPAQP